MATYLERLNAYVDGELDEPSGEEVTRLAASDTAVGSLVNDLKAVDALAQQALAPALDDPIPQRLRDALDPPPARPRLASGVWQMRVAAAVAVLAVGLGAGYLAARHNTAVTIAELERHNAQLAAALAVATERALEYQPSGQSVSQSAGAPDWRVTVTPLQTYRTAGDHYCRSVRQEIVRDGSLQEVTGVWCRVDKERWQARATEPQAPVTRAF